MPAGNDVVVTVTVGATVSENCLELVCGVGVVASVTVTVTVVETAAPGVPEITPELVLMDNPDGSPLADQANGVVPPLAATGPLYAEPAMPLGIEVVVMVSNGTIVMESCLVTDDGVGLEESVTVMFAVKVPVALVIPEIVPKSGSMANPEGNPAADQAYGVAPPLAVTGAE
jgi:hypothetical protein